MFYGINHDLKAARGFPMIGEVELAAGEGVMDPLAICNHWGKELPPHYIAGTEAFLRTKGMKFAHLLSHGHFAIAGLLISAELKEILQPGSFGIYFIPIDVYGFVDFKKPSPIPPEKRQYYMTHVHTPANHILDQEKTIRSVSGGAAPGEIRISTPVFKQHTDYDFFFISDSFEPAFTCFFVSERAKAQIEQLERSGVEFVEFPQLQPK